TVFNRGPSTGSLLMSVAPRPSRRPGATGTEPPATPSTDMRVVRSMELTTLSWTRGTNGPVRGQVLRLPATPEEFERDKDALKGAWVLLPQTPARGMRETRARVSDQYAQRREAREKAASGTPVSELSVRERVALIDVAGYISTSRDERVWTGSISDWRTTPLDKVPPEVAVVVRLSDYDYMNSRIADGEKIFAEFDLRHELIAGPAPVFNTIAEIRGSDLPHEVVYVSAHLDSWDGPGSQGTTDNGTGVVVSLEAARILMAANAKPRRTIRFGLWTGEEQGLLGSDWHVQNRKSEWANWSACFNDDGGTNYQGGLTASTDAMAQMLAEVTAPVNGLFFDSVDGKPLNVTIRRTRSLRLDGGSDHVSFNKVGVPGFFWSEVGRANYGFGWHTQNDKLDLAIPEYLKQSSTSTAIAAYRLASAPSLLPREPMPVEENKAAVSERGETVAR
ncbi:MAG: M20/M25/M40 family metallo-hydrolase, partial [Phycisphaerales bacterium]|nr:M20/M25/M40 family metallo-hydrolase [Phycisphaerales bacterium]